MKKNKSKITAVLLATAINIGGVIPAYADDNNAPTEKGLKNAATVRCIDATREAVNKKMTEFLKNGQKDPKFFTEENIKKHVSEINSLKEKESIAFESCLNEEKQIINYIEGFNDDTRLKKYIKKSLLTAINQLIINDIISEPFSIKYFGKEYQSYHNFTFFFTKADNVTCISVDAEYLEDAASKFLEELKKIN